MGFAKRKPTSGKVKQAKAPPPQRPSISALNAIYRDVAHASYGQHIRHLVLASYWCGDALRYIRAKRPTITALDAKRYLNFSEWLKKAVAATTDAEKERCYVGALEAFRDFAGDLATMKSVKPFVKEYRERNKKKVEQAEKLGPKFAKIFDTLQTCFSSCSVALKVVPDIDGNRGPARRVSQDGKTMLYTRARAKEMLITYRRRGFLPVAFEVAQQLCLYNSLETLLNDILHYCEHNPDSPKRLVRNVVRNPIKPRTPRAKRTLLPHEKSLNQQLLDDLASELNNMNKG